MDRKVRAKNNLADQSKARIRTTMIGAIASIESYFGEMWENNPDLKQIYEDLRCEILDKGNKQIRLVDSDFANFEVSSVNVEPPLRRG